jgi:hypothetical protein
MFVNAKAKVGEQYVVLAGGLSYVYFQIIPGATMYAQGQLQSVGPRTGLTSRSL